MLWGQGLARAGRISKTAWLELIVVVHQAQSLDLNYVDTMLCQCSHRSGSNTSSGTTTSQASQ